VKTDDVRLTIIRHVNAARVQQEGVTKIIPCLFPCILQVVREKRLLTALDAARSDLTHDQYD
jgi:hypothetical protein